MPAAAGNHYYIYTYAMDDHQSKRTESHDGKSILCRDYQMCFRTIAISLEILLRSSSSLSKNSLELVAWDQEISIFDITTWTWQGIPWLKLTNDIYVTKWDEIQNSHLLLPALLDSVLACRTSCQDCNGLSASHLEKKASCGEGHVHTYRRVKRRFYC